MTRVKAGQKAPRAAAAESATAASLPSTLRQLRVRLQSLIPDLKLDDLTRPVVVLADVGRDGATAWRALTFDSDVSELFRTITASGDIASIEFEVRELFPEADRELRIVRMPVAIGDLMGDVRKQRSKSAQGRSASPGRAGRGSSKLGVRSVGRGRNQRNCMLHTSRSHFEAPASPPKAPPSKTPSKPSGHGQAEAVPSPVSSQVKASAGESARTYDADQTPEETGIAPESPMHPAVPRRPSSAPSERSPPGFRHMMPRTPEYEPPGLPKYDGRPGRRLDLEWAGKTSISTRSGNLSTYMLEAVGLREKYEQVRHDSVQSQAAIKQVLQVRDSFPGSTEASASLARWGVAYGMRSAELLDREASVGESTSWEQGKFCLVAGKDIAKINQVVDSLHNIEEGAITRLEDVEVAVTWGVASARRRIAIEKRLAFGRPQILPKRILVESQWLQFGDLGRVVFRFYPCGDGSASDGHSTVFLWMNRPPGISFTFILCLSGASKQELEAGTKAQVCSAPRLWQAHEVHYRLDVGWSEVASVLLDIDAEKSLDLTIRVLQWHAVEGLSQEFSGAAALHSMWQNNRKGASDDNSHAIEAKP